MESWLDQLWDAMTAVSLPLLILGLAFQTAQTLLVALAWRNILRAAYPEAGVTYRPIAGYYAGGNGLNAILPASAGTVAMLGLFRANIAGATVAGVVGATVVQNIFFAVVAVAVYLWLFLSVTGSFDVKLGWFADHWVLTIVIIVVAAVVLAILIRKLWNRLRSTWENAKEGGNILADRRKFMIQVVGVEAASYIARMGVNATFMYAYDIPVSLTNVFLIVASSSISSTVAVAPGAVGAQTAMTNVVLKGVAPSATISAYAVGQAIITTAWNAAFGLSLLAATIGWKETRALVHVRKKKDGDDPEGDGEGTATPVDEGAPPAV
jgi:uncharacterized membrane protein YbhN (UPF0104 family)